MRQNVIAAIPILALTLLGGCTAPSESDNAPQASSDTSEPTEMVEVTAGISTAVPEAAYAGQTDEEIAAAGPPQSGDALMLRLEKEPGTLGYILDTSDAYTADIALLIHEGLIDRNRDTTAYEPLVAERWEISEDKLSYTFYIDPAATFSDGKPVTAEDVKFTFDTILDEKNETADIRGYVRDIEDIEVIDERTVRFQVARAYFKHLDMIGGLPIYAKHIYSEGEFNTHPRHRSPFGSGPYVFDRWDTNSQIVLKRNPNYWREDHPVYLDRVVFKIISDDGAAFQVAERGEVDKASVMPENWVTRVIKPDFQEKYRGVKYWGHDGYYGGYGYICWNTRREIFADKQVRQALTMLMNRQGMVDTIYHGLGKVVSGSLAWQSPGYDQNIEPWPFDPPRAKALLEEAGWVDTDGDGIRDKDGKKFEFEFLLVTGRRETERFITVYKEELERAGIMMNIRPLEWASMLGSLVKRDYDATTLRWAIPIDSDPYQLWHSSQVDNGSNYPGLALPELDKLIEEARLEFDPYKRGELYKKVHAILHDEQPYTFLWNVNELSIVHRRFENVKLHTVGLYPAEWWVPKAAQMY